MATSVAPLACLTLLLIGTAVLGQQPGISKLEVGPQFSSLTLVAPAVKGEVGAGARFTLNLIDSIALESVVNYFPAANGVAAGGYLIDL